MTRFATTNDDGPTPAELAAERSVRRGRCPMCGGLLHADGRDPAACDCEQGSADSPLVSARDQAPCNAAAGQPNNTRSIR